MRQECVPHKGLVIRANKHKGDTWTKENQREIDIIQDKAFLELLAATEERKKRKGAIRKEGKQGKRAGTSPEETQKD